MVKHTKQTKSGAKGVANVANVASLILRVKTGHIYWQEAASWLAVWVETHRLFLSWPGQTRRSLSAGNQKVLHLRAAAPHRHGENLHRRFLTSSAALGGGGGPVLALLMVLH